MIIQVLQENLSNAITITSRFASVKAQLPVLANILLSAKKNKLIISATNLEMSVSLFVGAKVKSGGDITIPARVINDLVNNLKPGQINLSAKKERLSIKTSGFSSDISGMNSSDFPKVPQSIPGKALDLSREDFYSSLSQVLFSVSVDETRPVLTGVLVIMSKTGMVLVSTDGFRLSQKKLTLKNVDSKEGKIIIPKNTLSELLRLSNDEKSIKFLIDEKENQVMFGISDAVLSSRIIDGEFPDFERIIPKESKISVNVDKEELLRAIKLASVFARDAANVVKLSVKKTSLEISAESSQSGSQVTEVDAKVKSDGPLPKEGFEIAFNYRFLEEFLNAIEGEDVRIEFSQENSPGVFLDPKDKDFLHIIMPVRLND
jgi:DNA polymerase-3 subunit beta